MASSEQRNTDEPRQSWCYSTGEWTTLTDPLTGWETNSFEEMLEAASFEPWAAASTLYKVPLTLAVYSRSQEPCYLFDLKGSLTASQQFYAQTMSDALVLLNQLAPTLQAFTVTGKIDPVVSTWIPAGVSPPRTEPLSNISG